MSTPARAIVDDRHSEASLRRLVMKFAYLGCFVSLPLAFLVAPSLEAAGWVCANAGLALVFTLLSGKFGWVRTGSRGRIFAILVAYTIFIAVGAALGESLTGIGLLQVLPVVFCAFFFSGWVRYAIAVVAPAVEFLLLGTAGELSWREALARLVTFLVLAHFSVRIGDIVSESVRAHQSLHAVLEAATTEPLEPDLAERALHAALDVIDWDAGTVALVHDGKFVSAATAGLTIDLGAYHAEHPPYVHGDSTAATVVRTGEQVFVADAPSHYPAEHPLLAEGIRCVAGTPIPSRGEVIGVLLTAHRAPRAFDERERDRLAAVAEQLGLALGNARAWREEAHVAEGLRTLNRRKDEFLAAVSHELRTPATTIELAARTLHRGGDRLQKAERETIVLSLLRRSRDLRELIESLIDLALSESGDNRAILAPMDWQFCLTRWVAELSQQHARRIELDVPETTIVAMADAAKMERVVSSLVSNAVKFSADDTVVHVHFDADADTLRVAVTDQGMGILPDDLDRIFQRFLQLDGSETREANGLGIGLSIVKQFVSLHGGTVHVASSPGEGSTFTVLIPRRDPAIRS